MERQEAEASWKEWNMGNSNGIALAYLTALVSGISVFANSFGVVTMDATAYALVKNVAVAAIIAAIALSIGSWREFLALNRKQLLMLLFVGVVGGGVAFALYFNGLAATGGAVGSFLYRLLFVFAVVIAVGALKEKFEWKIAAGAIAILAGNWLLLGDAAMSLTGGALLVLAATVLWACEDGNRRDCAACDTCVAGESGRAWRDSCRFAWLDCACCRVSGAVCHP